MVTQKETEEFFIRLAGALTGGLEDAGLEGYQKSTGMRTFPFNQLNPKIPFCDDLIVGGLAIPPWVIGYLMEEDARKKGDMKAMEFGKNLEMFGEGDVIYALNMLIHHELCLLMEPQIFAPAIKVVSVPTDMSRADVGHKVTKF